MNYCCPKFLALLIPPGIVMVVCVWLLPIICLENKCLNSIQDGNVHLYRMKVDRDGEFSEDMRSFKRESTLGLGDQVYK